MFLELLEGEIKVTEQGKALKEYKELRAADKTKGKTSLKKHLRFIYFAYHKKSIYRNYLPRERERKVKEALFPEDRIDYFLGNARSQRLAKVLIETSYTFKEKLYRKLLLDVEDMQRRVSDVEMTRVVRIRSPREVTFFSKTLKQEVRETIDLDVRMTVDNSEEKFKALELLEKLLKKEEILKKKLKEEEIEMLTASGGKRLFDE